MLALLHGKRCGHCLKILKPDCFYKRSGKLHCWCKQCVLDSIKLCEQKRKAKNPRLFRSKSAKRMREWRIRNSALNRKRGREDKARLYRTSKSFRDAIRVKNQKNWAINKDKLRAQNKRYRETPAGRAAVRAAITKRRYRKRGATIRDGPAAVKRLESLSVLNCFYCGKVITDEAWHVEHLTPIARGGEHSAANVVPSCSSCNLSKGKLLPNEFIKKGQLVLL